MEWIFDDGGRMAAGYKGTANDCVVRAIAIAAGLPYQKVYDLVNGVCATEQLPRRYQGRRSTARLGIFKPTTRRVLETLGWQWTPTMKIGSGCQVHLRDGELPAGRLIVSLSHHLTAVIDGVIHDLYDPSRDGTRCVYGFWQQK